MTATPPPPGSAPLTGLSDAVSLVAALQADLVATEVLVQVVPAPARRREDGAEGGWCTRTRISTPHEEAARDLANMLRLVPRPNLADLAGWDGPYPYTESALRPLRVELVLTDGLAEPVMPLREVLTFLDFVTAVMPTDIPATQIRVRALGPSSGEAEIHTTDPAHAQTLQVGLAGLDLPVRPVVIAP